MLTAQCCSLLASLCLPTLLSLPPPPSSISRWNEALLSDAVAPAYLAALLEMSLVTGPSTDHLYSLFPPAPVTLQEPWDCLSNAFYTRHLSQSTAAVMWTEALGGRWLTAKQVRGRKGGQPRWGHDQGPVVKAGPLGHGCC